MNRKTIDYVCFNKDCENNKKGFCYLNGMIPSSGCIDGITKSGLDLKIENMNHRIKELEKENQQLKVSQKELAISELEKLKDFIDHNIEIENDVGALKLEDFYNNQIEELKQSKVVIDEYDTDKLKEDCVIYKSSINELYKSQKQLAIEELEFVLKNFRNRPAYFDVARQELCLSDQDKQFIDFINNRIKELGGGENE